MRFGDLDQLMDQVVRKKADWNNRKYMDGFNDCILRVRSMIHSAKTIDPETLSIVQELRAELAKVKAEKDALLKELAGECGVCSHYEDCIKNHCSCCDGSNLEYCGPKKER